jgi:hypothetical protein
VQLRPPPTACRSFHYRRCRESKPTVQLLGKCIGCYCIRPRPACPHTVWLISSCSNGESRCCLSPIFCSVVLLPAHESAPNLPLLLSSFAALGRNAAADVRPGWYVVPAAVAHNTELFVDCVTNLFSCRLCLPRKFGADASCVSH